MLTERGIGHFDSATSPLASSKIKARIRIGGFCATRRGEMATLPKPPPTTSRGGDEPPLCRSQNTGQGGMASKNGKAKVAEFPTGYRNRIIDYGVKPADL